MSVFKPEQMESLKGAKGHAYFLYHSPDDRICPYRMAEHAAKELKQHGATTKLTTYKGGHGWRGNLYKEVWPLNNEGQARSEQKFLCELAHSPSANPSAAGASAE